MWICMYLNMYVHEDIILGMFYMDIYTHQKLAFILIIFIFLKQVLWFVYNLLPSNFIYLWFMNEMDLRATISLEREKYKKYNHMKDSLGIQVWKGTNLLPCLTYVIKIKFKCLMVNSIFTQGEPLSHIFTYGSMISTLMYLHMNLRARMQEKSILIPC